MEEGGRHQLLVTGVFFHPEFSRQDWDSIGNKFVRFPAAMQHALGLEGVLHMRPEPVPEELLLDVHTRKYLGA